MTYKQITILNTYNQHIDKPKVGQVVYLILTNRFGSVPSTAKHNSESFRWQVECPTTNRGIQQPDGWLGDWLGDKYTSSTHSLGRWTVVSVVDKTLKKTEELEATEKFTVKLKQLGELT